MKLLISLVLFTIIACAPENTEIIVNNNVATSSFSGLRGKNVVLSIDGNEKGTIAYNSSKTLELDEGNYVIKLSAAPDQGLIWWTESDFHISEGETIEFTATIDELTWKSY